MLNRYEDEYDKLKEAESTDEMDSDIEDNEDEEGVD